jgi:hypothetical protein
LTPGQHFIISWVIANGAPMDRRGRVCVTLSGLLPDLDGFGYVVDRIAPTLGYHTHLFETYHHLFGHNLPAGLLLAAASYLACARRRAVFWLSLAAFHAHLLCDLAGSMGPDGYQWPIRYLYPLLPHWELTWSGQWELSSWQNSLTGVLFFVAALVIARYREVTFFELISMRIERTVVAVGRKRGFFTAPR